MPLIFFQTTSSHTDDVLPYFVLLLGLLIIIVMLHVYRANKKTSKKLGAEAYEAFDYKITLFIKIALYILVLFSLLTLVAAIGELVEIDSIDEFVYLLSIAFFGLGFSLISLYKEKKRPPPSIPSSSAVSKLDSSKKVNSN